MPAAAKVARTTHTAEDSRVPERSGKDARRNARLPVAAPALKGVGRAEAVRFWIPAFERARKLGNCHYGGWDAKKAALCMEIIP